MGQEGQLLHAYRQFITDSKLSFSHVKIYIENVYIKIKLFHLFLFLNWTKNHLLNTSVQFSCPVVSNSLWPHGLQHARPPSPSPTPRVYSNSCPLSWWCHPTISSSVVCRGPAPVDPGNSKRGRRRRKSGNNCLIKRLLRI